MRPFFHTVEMPVQNLHLARTQALWDNYWPGSRAIKARYQRVEAMIDRRNKGLHQSPTWDPSGHKNLADPVKFCRMSFPPDSFYNQDEFQSCLEAIGAKVVHLNNVGDSKIATDITGAPAGLHQPDGTCAATFSAFSRIWCILTLLALHITAILFLPPCSLVPQDPTVFLQGQMAGAGTRRRRGTAKNRMYRHKVSCPKVIK